MMESLEFRERLLYPGITPTIHCNTCKPNRRRSRTLSSSLSSNGMASDNGESHNKHSEEQNENGELVKLSEESLMRQPEEVFDIICKLGEGSYGSVYKALHKESGQVLAIKQVPIDTDLQEIIKEISIMQQCDSQHVVKYYGSYFKDSDLWIVMEYCGAGSVSDIMRLRKKTLTEEEIATVILDTLRGLEYLHLRRKIHRDIKAGNILLNTQGHAKLADFGVAGQLSDTMAKRNTVIGTPFWMAPEVIQEIGYDCVADIWSLGITALEMAEGKPPYGDIHPMRAIFMIPTKPPPSFREPDQWQPEFIDFVSRCLVKNPEERATASELLQHQFIRGAQPSSILRNMLEEAMEIRENQNSNRQIQIKHITDSDDEEVDSSTMVRYRSGGDSGTLRPLNNEGTLVAPVASSGTLVAPVDSSTLSTDVGTMVINSDNEDEDDEDSTMKRHDTAPGEQSKKYRPLFLDHFDKKEQEKKARSKSSKDNSPLENIAPQQYVGTGRPILHPTSQSIQLTTEDNLLNQQAQLQQQQTHTNVPQQQRQIHMEQQQVQQSTQDFGEQQNNTMVYSPTALIHSQPKPMSAEEHRKFELKHLTYDELHQRMATLDQEMEREIDELRQRYQAKRQPILDAMDQKRKRQQNF
ncbi:serine/threonine-protein kinase 3 isoform X11 [Macrobrachium rosenbergii]|uniref:serine/threonine-protein kinase 3 isoform X11 n=1 Tax=Macrobrachium rosenbergii TaxID=79674 RepID=UPI0034D595F3